MPKKQPNRALENDRRYLSANRRMYHNIIFNSSLKETVLKNWKQRYQDAHKQYQLREYPSAVNDHGVISTTFPDVSKEGGLIRMTVNYARWTNNHLERTNAMGVPIKKFRPKYNVLTNQVEMLDNGIDWKKSGVTTGTSDVKGHWRSPKHSFPIPLYVEIKIGRDTMKDAQIQYEARINKTGGVYGVIKTPEDFFKLVDYVESL